MIHGDLDKFNVNPFEIYNKGNVLVTAGDLEHRNSMTISWGCLGTLFNKKVAIVFVKKSRFTKHLLDEADRFTLSFLSDKYKDELIYMGRHSGRDLDKYKETGLTPIYDTDTKVSYIKQSDFVFKVKKIYQSEFIKDNIFDKSIVERFYGDGEEDNLHTMYIAEITSFLVAEDEI
jgi:flavin reductase (DIM6/NTAB) family NADH-FMN oxidoreductase RutF